MRSFSVAGIVFANSHDELLGKLTAKRSMASVPFGGRYRIIDFTLSNLVNAGIHNVGIITKENYRSLMDHLGSGIFWDLDRKNGGLHILPPYNVRGARRYNGYIEALNTAMDFIRRCNAEYLVVCDCDTVSNIDISAALEFHNKMQADVTVVSHHGKKPADHSDTMILSLEPDCRINNIRFSDEPDEDVEYSLGITIIGRQLLEESVEVAYNSEGTSINRDILAKLVSKLRIYAYKYDGYAAVMDCEKTYFDANRDLLDANVRKKLFSKERPVYTKTRDDMPTRYGTKSVTENCFIADGCVIDGTVKNSVLFRGVKVEKGAVVENSIIMQGTRVESGAKLDYVVSDKNAVVSSDVVVKGTLKKPFLVKKNQAL